MNRGCKDQRKNVISQTFEPPLTDVGRASDETQLKRRLETQPPHQNRLNHVEHGHGVDLVAPSDVQHHHEVRRGNKPPRPVDIQEDVVVDMVTVRPIADDGDREVAYRHHGVGQHHPPPHGHLGRPLLRGRNCCLNLQHHVVARVRECHSAQRVECIEDVRHFALLWQMVVCVLPGHQRRVAVAIGRRNAPRNRRVTAQNIVERIRSPHGSSDANGLNWVLGRLFTSRTCKRRPRRYRRWS